MARILFIGRVVPGADSRPDLSRSLSEAGMDVRDLPVPYGSRWLAILRVLMDRTPYSSIDAVVTTEYNLAFAVSLRMLFVRNKATNIAVGFNLSSRPLQLGFKPIDVLINRVFGALDIVIVHSNAEVELMSNLHKLDRAKFKFVPWGFDLPAVNPKSRPNIDTSGPLFCMIGRNNRDFKTFADAISRTEARGVIITGGRNDIGTVEETGKLHILRDVAMDECIGWMTASTANVILVNDENRGAGHITAVLGMLLEKPHIFSRVSTLSDYLDDGVHGIAVPVGDAGAVAGACHALLKDGALARKMGKAAKTRAETEFSNEAVRGSILNAILAGINRQ